MQHMIPSRVAKEDRQMSKIMLKPSGLVLGGGEEGGGGEPSEPGIAEVIEEAPSEGIDRHDMEQHPGEEPQIGPEEAARLDLLPQLAKIRRDRIRLCVWRQFTNLQSLEIFLDEIWVRMESAEGFGGILSRIGKDNTFSTRMAKSPLADIIDPSIHHNPGVSWFRMLSDLLPTENIFCGEVFGLGLRFV